jgi:hypothetical protein
MASIRCKACVASLASAALLAAVPAGASAANTFVDATRPNDSGSCLTPATACETIGAGIAKATLGSSVFVVDPAAPTTYSESVVLGGGKSLVSLSPNSAETIIDNGTGPGMTPAILVPSAGGDGRIQGFTIRSDFQAILARDQITVASNVFDEDASLSSSSKANVQLDPAAGASVVTGNVFRDPTPLTTAAQRGLSLFNAGTATVSGNSFSGFSQAILNGGALATPVISGNEISGTHPDTGAGAAIDVEAGSPTITANRMHDPVIPAGELASGISIKQAATGATLRRNQITDHSIGVEVIDAPGVTLSSDLIARSGSVGVLATDTGADDVRHGDVTAINATIVESAGVPPASEIELMQTQLTLSSTIVGNGGIGGTGTCLISFSRGPTTSGAPCQAFQTSATPGFVDPGANYHLRAGSAMIDAGDPSAPAFGELDIDGGLRAVDAIRPCGVRRDIGADEFVAIIDCQSPDTSVKGPSKVRVRKKQARLSFQLTATEVGALFQCSVDDKAFIVCPSPFTVRLRRGKHVLTVRAIDASGNPDTSPARLGITVATKKKRRRAR